MLVGEWTWRVCLGVVLGAMPSSLAAQNAAADSARAVTEATRAARHELVTLYGMVGFVAAPAAAGGLIALSNAGGRPVREVAAGTAGVVVIGVALRHTPGLPLQTRQRMQQESAAYQAQFARTYGEVLRSRRGKAFAIGSALGILAAIAMLSTVSYT